jgi:GNAT superfamily N-acetyltransferase
VKSCSPKGRIKVIKVKSHGVEIWWERFEISAETALPHWPDGTDGSGKRIDGFVESRMDLVGAGGVDQSDQSKTLRFRGMA